MKKLTKKFYYCCYDCNYEWKSYSKQDTLCPICGNKNIDYLGKLKTKKTSVKKTK